MIIDIVLGRAIGKGGLEKVLTLISNDLTMRGYRVRICQMSEPDHMEWAESLPEIYYYGQQDKYEYADNINVFHWAIGYQNLINKIGKPDIVLATHTPIISLICKLALNFLGDNCPPIISWLHGPPKSYGGGNYLKFSDAHLAISHNISRKIRESIETSSPVHYIGNPVKITNTQLINRPEDIFEFLYVGRLDNSQKRLDVLFKSLSNVKGNWRIRIIGDGPDSSILKAMATQLNIGNRISWEGWIENPWEEVKEASLLILSSDYEGFGLVLVEALARGIPVVSTNCEGPDEIIQDGVNGWLYPVQDTITLQNILQEIILGKRALPEAKVCCESILHYRPEIVISLLEEVLNTYYNLKTINKKLLSITNLSEEEIAQEVYDLIVSKKVNIESVFSGVYDQLSNSLKSKWLTRVGVLFWENQLFDNVIPAFQQALEFEPYNDDALFNLGYFLKGLGEYELALYYFNQIGEKNNEVFEMIGEIQSAKRANKNSVEQSQLVSILIPTFNRPEYVELALKSALDQTYKNVEIIICDNSRNEETFLIIKPFLKEHSNLVYFKNEDNLGMVGNMRRCLEYAKGEFIAFLGDDDIWVPSKLEKIVPFFMDDSVQYVTSTKLVINQYGEELYVENKIAEENVILDGEQLAEFALLNDNFIGEPSVVVYRKSALDFSFGEYCGQTFNFMMDLATWLNILRKGKAVFLSEILTYYRIHENNMAGQLYYKEGIQEWKRILEIAHENGYLQNREEYLKAYQNLHRRIVLNIRKSYNENRKIENIESILEILNDINKILITN